MNRHKKQKEEDIAICECKYNANDPHSACGDRCLNVLTSTECTPGYCPCGIFCKNKRFQKCEYVKTKLFKTEGLGWGLLADENIKAGQFVIEYCGEVISWKEAKSRSQDYEIQGKYVGNQSIKLCKSKWKERTDYEALEKQKNQTQKKLKLPKKGVLHK